MDVTLQLLAAAVQRTHAAAAACSLPALLNAGCRAQKQGDVAAVVQDDVAWTALQKSMQELQTRTRVLYKVLKFVAGRGHLRPLFLQLDLNQFYAQQQ